ncbi:M14 family metallopeptidase [Aureibaculum conchae]|uniref:M14 family metallopeptidase n=1 Tax=Aureibaculum sp. 2308TA14-22 TaxID=3108392 RepID=UPI0033919F73
MKNIFFFCLLFLITLTTFSQLKSPAEFLGYELGDRFTRHHQVVDYFKHIAKENENVKLIKYGETYENRTLQLAFITAPKNFSKLENLRTNHLKSIGILNGEANSEISIVWLSYNVHGNESVSTEAAMKTLYALVDSNNTETKKWLENTIVIIDPCINPDGRDRYVNWYNQYQNKPYNINPDSKEHHEPWPGGRANHYLFDLNRDWAWATQTETQSRLEEYNKWMPHVHVDFHEQGVNSPYYFAPAAEPYHEIITDFQREFQVVIGKNHAKYFDKNSWLYFTKERFDLLYPSYGDTYPMYNGAIGMTYEQGGSGRAGLGIKTADDDVLTLKDRIAHHYTTGLSTIEMASDHADKLQQEFIAYFNRATNNPKGKYKSYVISGSNGKDKLNSLKKLLEKHQIKYGMPTSNASVKAFDYESNTTKSMRFSSKDMVINTNQPKSNFINALFEPQTKIVDSLTYDITAWSIPYSRGLKAYALANALASESMPADAVGADPVGVEKPYAYLAKWNSTDDATFLGYLLQNKVKVRFSESAFTIEGNNYKAGTLVITRRGNEKLGEKFDAIIRKATQKFDRKVTGVATGFVTKGKDFGSSAVRYLKAPKIAVLSGDGVSSLGFGEIWHFFEQQIHYPITVLDTEYFNRVNLDKYNVLVLPSGWYDSLLNKDKLKEIKKWVQNGGRLIVIDRALSVFADSEAFDLSNYKDDDEKSEKQKEKKAQKQKLELEAYDQLERKSLSNLITGSIFKATMDNTHPLGFGYGKNYNTLRLSSNRYAYLKNGSNVSVIKSKNDLVSGFAGANALNDIEKSLVFGVERKGRGAVIYLADNPLFRSFWENGKLVFCNAVFMVGQ